jgi:acetyltransferase
VAVIGASSSPEKAGHVLLRNIVQGGFPGAVYPVNPRGGEILGLQVCSSVHEVPTTIDLAFIVVGRKQVLSMVEACAEAGVRAVCIVTAGFGEGDAWGKEEQLKIAAVVAQAGMIAIGPNTIGTISMGGLLVGSFVPFPHWQDGPVAIGAQTGIFAGAVALELMSRDTQRIGITASVDIGNRVGIDEVALLEDFALRDEVRVIGFYLEELADPRRFLKLASEVKRTKPVVVLRPGRTAQGASASASHTGSLAQDDAVIDQLLSQHGLVRAEDTADFLAILRAFSFAGVPAGSNVGVVTYSGALGVIASDQIVREGLDVASLEQRTIDRIGALMPDWQLAGNPADLWSAAEIDPEATLRVGFDAMLADSNVDQLLAVMLAVPNIDFPQFRDSFTELRTTYPGKPIHLVLHGGLSERWTSAVEGLGVPVYAETRDAVRAMAATARYAAGRDRVPTAHMAV